MKLQCLLKWTTGGVLLVLLALVGWGFISYWTGTNECDENKTGALTHPMKVVRYCEYGVVTFDDVEKPVPKDNQLLIKVRAASLNWLDAAVIRDMWLVRLVAGLRKPRDTRLGRDLAGVVEAVGKDVTQFKPGDEVFGSAYGSLAEYICNSGRALVIKPANISFVQAASVPHAGQTALQGLRAGKIRAGQKVLINGATGGVGTFAVQIAQSFGAEVTAVCSTRNMELVRSIGADHVIDYTREDFTKGEQRYDMIFDNVGNRSAAERRRVLKRNGICVLAGLGGTSTNSDQTVKRILATFTTSWFGSSGEQKFVRYTTRLNKEDVALLGELLETGKIKPVIERICKLRDAPEALRLFDQGHARGKTVITME
ncbi:MAG TPA: NAD(P)-dependent alcohol dehydrogenase [Chthoniobacterales bacterium]|jgi:NADPH:quinone reductase-like Zn-dependent oxidoreductase|nr:NAD(P)-dependent alcohol dehydrogenase [Chthoniobacterales bacterium]